MSYSELKYLGPALVSSVDPSGSCVGHKYKWEYGGSGITPTSSKCGGYMAERCSKVWDSHCEIYSHDLQTSVADTLQDETGVQLNVGEKFIRNALQDKYCKVLNTDKCKQVCEPFIGSDVDSPIVCRYEGECYNTCEYPHNYDDNLVNKCLDNPGVCDNVLDNICNNSKDIDGTRLGEYCYTSSKSVNNYRKGYKRSSCCLAFLIIILIILAIYFLNSKCGCFK